MPEDITHDKANAITANTSTFRQVRGMGIPSTKTSAAPQKNKTAQSDIASTANGPDPMMVG